MTMLKSLNTIARSALDVLFETLSKLKRMFKNPFKSDPGSALMVLPPEQHDWQLVAKTFAPPIKDLTNITDAKLLEKALFGVTTLLWQCSLTGDTKIETMIGSDENHLQDILERAEKFGMQYVPFNGKKFAIALVPSEEVVPLR